MTMPRARVSPARRIAGAIGAAEFDRIAADLRQCGIINAICRGAALWLRPLYQLFFQPAVTLLLVAPCGVSPIAPETVTPSESFCSAPILRSHLSSPDDRLWPAVTLVPLSPMSSLAD